VTTAATWTAEFDSTGQVVLPQRRKRLWIRVAILSVFLGNKVWSFAERGHDQLDTIFAVLSLVFMAVLASAIGFTFWQLVTRRPVVTIDRTGVRVGRRSLAWSDIARIESPTGPPGLRTVVIAPTTRVDTRALGIHQDNASDLRTLATWLQAQHTQRRRSDD
jgi:hypothetical protein